MNRKEYMKEYMRKKRMKENGEPSYDWQDIPISHFDGYGRGVPVNGYVLVSKGWTDIDGEQQVLHGVLTVKDWEARLDYECKHGREGWSCKKCLKG